MSDPDTCPNCGAPEDPSSDGSEAAYTCGTSRWRDKRYPHTVSGTCNITRLTQQRDEARAEVAHMRPIVEAAGQVVTAISSVHPDNDDAENMTCYYLTKLADALREGDA